MSRQDRHFRADNISWYLPPQLPSLSVRASLSAQLFIFHLKLDVCQNSLSQLSIQRQEKEEKNGREF